MYQDEDEVMFSEELDIKEIEITEETLKLRELYPFVEVTHEELVSYCEPWKKALVLTLLGKRIS